MDLSATRELTFSFGPFRMIPGRQLLLLGDCPVKLGGRAFELLRALVQRGGELVSKDELMAAAWPETFVHDSNLKVNMCSLRRSLGDTQIAPTYVATIAGRGYRFVAPVQIGTSDLLDQRAPATSTALHRVPAQGDIIGREEEIARILTDLRGNRHVTVVGAGGVGKTTVAVAVAQGIEPEFPDGACFVDLSTIDDPALVPAALVAALGIRGNPADPLTAVIDHLGQRRMLVVLDNCEHVLPAAAIFAHRLVADAGEAKLLATSREPLGTPAECVVWLESLACPEHGDGLTAEEAVRFPALELFRRRAAEWAGYDLADVDCAAIVQICRALDGLPLAIELAAAKMEFHSAPEIVAMLDEHLGFHNKNAEDAAPRQHTLLATIDWSFRLLSQNEATIFRLVSVFADAFELEDVVAIAEAAALNPVDVTIALGGLVAKSLVTAEVNGPGLRYRLLYSTRSYAMRRRQEKPTDARAPLFHAQRILSIFEQSEAEWDWRESGDWASRYQCRLADLRVALSWAFGEEGEPALGIRLTAAAIPLWFEMSLIAEAQAQVELALEFAQTHPCNDQLKAKLASSRAWSLAYAHKLRPDIEHVWRDAISFAERAGNIGYRLQALVGFSFYLLDTGRVAAAIERLAEFAEAAERHRYRSADPEGERVLAWARAHMGELAESRRVLDRLAAAYARPDRRSRMAGFQVDRYIGIRSYLSPVAWLNGLADDAATTARDAVQAAGSLRHLMSQANVLALAALPVSLWNGDLPALERYTAQLQSILERENIAIWSPVLRFYTAALGDLRGEADAIRGLRDSTDALIESGFTIRLGMCLGILAEALSRQGRLEEASDTIAKAFHYQVRQGERWCRSELQRIEAAILDRMGRHADAERLLRNALEEARAIGAASFELRIASDLAARLIQTDRSSEAIRLLKPVYLGFTQGFTTKDLLAAARLLRVAYAAAPGEAGYYP